MVVCPLDLHECRDLSYEGSCGATCKESCEAGGSISTTFEQTVYSSGSQLFCSDTRFQSGVGVNSGCKGVFIGDACMVFCAEGCQVVPNETSIMTDTCHRCGNSLCRFFGVGFSECLSAGRLRECVQQEASVSQAVVSLLHPDGNRGTKWKVLSL